MKIRVFYSDPHKCSLLTWITGENEIPAKMQRHRIQWHTIDEFRIDYGNGYEPYNYQKWIQRESA